MKPRLSGLLLIAVGGRMKPHIVWVLTLAAVLLAGSSWPGDSWAQTRIPRVGIIAVGAAADDTFARYRFDMIRRALNLTIPESVLSRADEVIR
jgi:hypothetical protein